MGKDVRDCESGESGEEGVGGDGMQRLLEGRDEMKWLLETKLQKKIQTSSNMMLEPIHWMHVPHCLLIEMSHAYSFVRKTKERRGEERRVEARREIGRGEEGNK